jgi:hypothetical protein
VDTLVYDHTESPENGGIFQGRSSKGPLFTRRGDGRLQWKRMLGADQHQTEDEMKVCHPPHYPLTILYKSIANSHQFTDKNP